MNIMFIIALVSLTLQFGMTIALLILGSAPRWRRVRWFGAVAFTAGCYSLVDAVAAVQNASQDDVSWSLRLNLFNGVLHSVAWLTFTYMGESGRFSSLPLWVRRWSIGGVAAAALLAVTGTAVADPTVARLVVPSLGVDYPRVQLTAFGAAISVVPIFFLGLSAAGYVRRWRMGEPGAGWILVGFTLFLVTVFEEIAVAAGWIQFIFLADIGYVFVVTPVALQLLLRFRVDADQLDLLTDHLADEVRRRTDERDRAREQILEQQRLAALGRLAAGVGHEINNPLQFLRFTLEELRECARGMENTDAIDMIDQSFEGVDRIRQVVEDLRTYVRPREVELVPLDLRDVVQSALRVGAPQWRQGITIDTDLEPVPLVKGHEGRLVQVVLNPLVNGMQSMLQSGQPGRTTMRVHTRTTSRGWAEITIVDQGLGFDDAIISRLGEPYVTTKSELGGTGLGLFVSRGIVEAHGGVMTFTNVPNGGAMVRIELPPCAFTPPATAIAANDLAAASTLPTPAPLRVLMVEDDAQALRALLRGLEKEQVHATGFTDGQEALTWLAAHAVDVVVTDLMMPGMSGWEFAAALAQQHPALRERLVVLTGGAATEEAQAFVADPALCVLEKPIGRAELARVLRTRAT